MMGMINKTDRPDVHGLNRLQRTGTLPTVWIPPGPLRDLREVTRTRMVLLATRRRAKNRLTATLTKYALNLVGVSDPFGRRSRPQLEAANSVALNHRRQPDRHVSRRYRQIRRRKGHATAIGALARNLAEAPYHVWSRGRAAGATRTWVGPGRRKRNVVMSPPKPAE